jgi:hypothetical protein
MTKQFLDHTCLEAYPLTSGGIAINTNVKREMGVGSFSKIFQCNNSKKIKKLNKYFQCVCSQAKEDY